MSLAQGKASKRYKDKHREEQRLAMKRNYKKNKDRQLKASHKRTREITKGAKRWRETIGRTYWNLKYSGYG